LAATLRRHDFKSAPKPDWDTFRQAISAEAAISANTIFHGKNPLVKFHLKKKPAFRVGSLSDDLVVRKLAQNIKRITTLHSPARGRLVKNVRHFLDEGVPYRIYRLDVRQFYESFSLIELRSSISSLAKLSPLSKQHADSLLDYHSSLGGTGLPRGMALSAVLADLMMQDFDSKVCSGASVYFYGRYVDDIVIVTNTSETKEDYLLLLAGLLPSGLKLNHKKTTVCTVAEKCKVEKSALKAAVPRFLVDYLGYQFSVYDPTTPGTSEKSPHRVVRTEIAPTKIKKLKRRIVRIFVDFEKTADAQLLIDRIKFLTSNFSVIDKNTAKKKLAGVYFGYPALSPDSKSLSELDHFLRNAVLSNKGRLFKKWPAIATAALTRKVLAQSFKKGFSDKRFVYFSPVRIGEIQECWRYE